MHWQHGSDVEPFEVTPPQLVEAEKELLVQRQFSVLEVFSCGAFTVDKSAQRTQLLTSMLQIICALGQGLSVQVSE